MNRCLRQSAVTDAGQRADDGNPDICLLCALHLLDRVSLNHVTDLVPESSSQLVQCVGALDQPAIHVHVSTRQREGIHLPRVHDVEMPLQIRAARGPRNRLAELLDVSADDGVGNDRQLRVDFFSVLTANRDFLVLRYRAGSEDKKERGQDRGTNHFARGIRVNSGGQIMFHFFLPQLAEGHP